MGHHGDPELDQLVDELDLRPFDLDGAGAALLQEAAGVADSLLDAHLVREEGHVADDEGVRHPARDRAGVVEHLLHRDGQGVLVAQDVVADRVADQQHRNPGLVEDLRGGEIVGRKHREPRALGLPRLQVADGDRHRSRLLRECTAAGS